MMSETTECESPTWLKSLNKKIMLKCHRRKNHQGKHEWCMEWD